MLFGHLIQMVKRQRFLIQPENTTLVIGFEPADISREAISPEEMSFSELQLFVNELATSGVDNRRWEVNLHGKISFAFTNLIIVLFAVPMVHLVLKVDSRLVQE